MEKLKNVENKGLQMQTGRIDQWGTTDNGANDTLKGELGLN